MSIECGECEHDLRGPHDEKCSRYRTREHIVGAVSMQAYADYLNDRSTISASNMIMRIANAIINTAD